MAKTLTSIYAHPLLAVVLALLCVSCAPAPTDLPSSPTPSRTDPVVVAPSATQTTLPATATPTTMPTAPAPPGTEAPTPYPPSLASTRTVRVTTGTPLPYSPPRTPVEHR